MKLTRPFNLGIVIGLFLGIIFCYFLLLRPIQKKEAALQAKLKEQMSLQSGVLDSIRNIHLTGWMGSLMTMLNDDLMKNPSRQLTDKTIAQISNLCFAAHPYPSLTADGLTSKQLSPERGQILLVLSKLNLDTTSIQSILNISTFAYADLRGADLRGVYLPGIDLQHADLQGAQLQNADLRNANLNYANFWGAHMAGIQLMHAHLKRADLQWADLNRSNLSGAELSGANLRAVQARNSDFSNVELVWAAANDAFFHETDFHKSDLTGTNFMNAHLNGTNLDSSNLAETTLLNATLDHSTVKGANLLVAIVGSTDWFDQLHLWNVSGIDSLPVKYQIKPREYGGKTYLRLEPHR